MIRTFIFIITLLIAPHQVFGATLSLHPVLLEGASLDQAQIEVVLDSNESINAVEGVIVVPERFGQDVAISLGDTVVNFWIEEPSYKKEKGGIVFSGIIPGGISGPSRVLFSFRLPRTAYTEGSRLEFSKATLFLSDGQGSVLVPTTREVVLSRNLSSKKTSLEDKEVPEDFTIQLGRDINIFDGAYFVVFATTDKGEGIDRYEVREGLWGVYREVASPYRLNDQELHKNIWIRAIDRAGNTRVVVLPAENGVSLWEKSKTFGILGGGIIIYLIILLCRKFFMRS